MMDGHRRKSVIAYQPDLVISNLDELPRGTRARYLECMRGPGETLIAKCWHRSIPLPRHDIIVVFGGRLRK
jgi:hypothetical protein